MFKLSQGKQELLVGLLYLTILVTTYATTLGQLA